MFYNRDIASIDFSNFDASCVTSIESMFQFCKSITSVDMSCFSEAPLTNMDRAFYSCSSLESVDLSMVNMSNIEVAPISQMFYNCENLKSVKVGNLAPLNSSFNQYTFDWCTTNGVLKIPYGTSEKWSSLISVIPSTWTVEEY
jgi:hypothetical protein